MRKVLRWFLLALVVSQVACWDDPKHPAAEAGRKKVKLAVADAQSVTETQNARYCFDGDKQKCDLELFAKKYDRKRFGENKRTPPGAKGGRPTW